MDLLKPLRRQRSADCELSVIVVYFNMAREIQRTLHSLSRPYQREVEDLQYEVIVVDNGSPVPLPEAQVTRHGDNVSLLRVEATNASPAAAINQAVRISRGRYIGVIIDGARMLTPGVLNGSRQIFRQESDAVVATLGFHLGPELQRLSSLRGYDQALEDELLERIDWQQNGYRLFEIAALAGSSRFSWFGPIAECNCIVLSRSRYQAIGGYDADFVSVGGGLVNLDFYKRACEHEPARLFYLLGEGCFHQIHGGVTTGGSGKMAETFSQLHVEYRGLRGVDYEAPANVPVLHGQMPAEASWLNEVASRNLVDEDNLLAKMNEHLAQVGLDYHLRR